MDVLIAAATALTWFVQAAQPLAVPLLPHPCDSTPTPTSIRDIPVGATFEFGWCHNSQGTNGIAGLISEFRVYRNGQQFAVLTPSDISPVPVANVNGLTYYRIMQTEQAQGQTRWDVAAVMNGIEGAHGGELRLRIAKR